MKLELFMDIPGYENYKISSYGRVLNKRRNKEVKQFLKRNGYSIVSLFKDKKKKTFTIHRLVAKTFFEEDITNKSIDHIDGNKQNNFFQNLRVCNHQQNHFNRGKNKNNTSGFKGVSWEKKKEKWAAKIQINGTVRTLGRFNDKHEAYEKYKEAAKYYHGDYLYQYL